MATEDAGGPSTTAIATMLAHGARDWHRPADLAAARAELAALVEAAGRVGPLRAALSGLLGGIDRDDRPDPGQSLCRGLHTLRLVDEAIALVVGGAGGGAAGARDETARKAAAFDNVACSNCHGYGRTERPGSPPDAVPCISCGGIGVKGPGLLDRFPLDFDAPRAGGAGEATDEA